MNNNTKVNVSTLLALNFLISCCMQSSSPNMYPDDYSQLASTSERLITLAAFNLFLSIISLDGFYWYGILISDHYKTFSLIWFLESMYPQKEFNLTIWKKIFRTLIALMCALLVPKGDYRNRFLWDCS